MIAGMIVVMMDLRDRQGGATTMGMGIIMIMERAKGRGEQGVRMRMRKYLKLRLTALRRRADHTGCFWGDGARLR
jgi:hypothetical protein